MCFKSPKATTPAKAPAAPLEGADPAEIGETRRDENEENFGSDTPDYRVERPTGKPSLAPDEFIRM